MKPKRHGNTDKRNRAHGPVNKTETITLKCTPAQKEAWTAIAVKTKHKKVSTWIVAKLPKVCVTA